VAIKFDSKRTVRIELTTGPAEAPIDKQVVVVAYRSMTTKEQAKVRGIYAAMASQAAAQGQDMAEAMGLTGGGEDALLDLACALISDIRDEDGEAATFDGEVWSSLSLEARREHGIGLGRLLTDVLGLAGGGASARVLGK